MKTLTSSISPSSLGTDAEISTAQPEPAAGRPRWIGHDHLRSLGFAEGQIHGWLASGVLSSPQGDGFYLRTPEFDAQFARLTSRRVIGRGHLLALGATPGLIARWLHHGTLQRTEHRGFYEITRAAFETLRPSSPPEVPAAPDPPAAPIAAEPKASPTPPTGEPPAKLRVVPCTITRARAFVAEHHRHLAPPVSGLFAVGIARGEDLVGVAIVGRPVARELQDGRTAEVTRVCTAGERNACSMLLSACRRGAHALGYQRLVTYTLTSEPGTSLRAAGWHEVASVRGRSWNCPSRPRSASPARDKRRWEAPSPGVTASLEQFAPTPPQEVVHVAA